jgi:hypothetical protein
VSQRAAAIGLALLWTATAVGCASSRAPGPAPTPISTPRANQSPEQSALAWFAAINGKDKAAAFAAFAPSSVSQMNWGNCDTTTWPTFSAVKCSLQTEDAVAASVACTFTESQVAAAGNPDTFWTVYFQRAQSRGPWLINNYGQG